MNVFTLGELRKKTLFLPDNTLIVGQGHLEQVMFCNILRVDKMAMPGSSGKNIPVIVIEMDDE